MIRKMHGQPPRSFGMGRTLPCGRLTRVVAFVAIAFWVNASVASESPVVIQVDIEPLPPPFTGVEPVVSNHVAAAAQLWVQHVDAPSCVVEIELRLQKWPARGFGHSLSNAPLNNERPGGRSILQEGMAYKLRTGKSVHNGQPDAEVVFDPEYFKTLWWDPFPHVRQTPVPSDKLDALSVILHELGHAIAFNGFINPTTGELPQKRLSAYDRWVSWDGSNFFFNGPAAVTVYGRPVPLERKNYHHVGDKVPGVDPVLKNDLMNGVVMQYGHRYSVSPLDVAILADCGLPVKR